MYWAKATRLQCIREDECSPEKKHIFFFRKNRQTVEVNSALQSISQIFCKTGLNKIFAKSEKEIEQVFARMSVAMFNKFPKKYFRESRKGS